MKRTIPIFMLCCLLALSACGKLSNEELTSTIPRMIATDGSSRAAATQGGGSWTYQGQSLAIDALHPLQAQEILFENSTLPAAGGAPLLMSFSVLPDSVSVQYWSADAPVGDSIPEGQTAEVSFSNNLFSFTVPEGSGNLVVRAEADWNSYSDWSGTVDYGFIIQR